MEHYEREILVAKLLSGATFFRVGKNRYKIINPNPDQRLLGEEIASEAVLEASFKQLLSDEEAEDYLHEKGIWTHENEQAFKESEKLIEDMKVELFQTVFNKKAADSIRRKLSGVRDALGKGLLKKYSIAPMTLEFYRRTTRDQFLVAICTYDMEGNRAYTENTYFNADSTIMEKAYTAREADGIGQSEMRELARTEPWRGYWAVSKQNVFGSPSANFFGPRNEEAVIIPSSHLNQYQRAMVSVCKMYDNAFQHPDCPNETVIEDDDCFDGWMIHEGRKREKEQKKKRIDEAVGQKGDEIFVMSDKDEAKEIFDVNDEGDNMRLRQRFKQIHKEGIVDETKLFDVKMDLNRQAHEQARDRRRKL
tara:strand:+ start:8168 stop:9259 length:1092 start_codon:yes stop_codon:yes gene_type:complete